MRQRPPNSKTEREGLLAVEHACHDLDLIWRDQFQEDVGIDGTIEIALGAFPTGKLVAAQVKSGMSYIRSETDESFRFYPRQDDLTYWGGLSIPLFLLVYHPENKTVYWADVQKTIAAADDEDINSIEFSKSAKLNSEFVDYLKARFDLKVYDDEAFAVARSELEKLQATIAGGTPAVKLSGLDLFLEGLWGLCTKVQFHSSLVTDLLRYAATRSAHEIDVRYTLSKATLYPFFSSYFALLGKHHLASLDFADINNSLYGKMEFPTFVAPLTTNGRRFVEFLRAAGLKDVHDRQYFSLISVPLVQIEIFDTFTETDKAYVFGRYTDVLSISFNPHLDYYRMKHVKRNAAESVGAVVRSQSIFFFELAEYIGAKFGGVEKERIVLRHLDLPLNPLGCWLENWYGDPRPYLAETLSGRTNAKQMAFHEEVMSIMAPVGAMSVVEPATFELPIPHLMNGEHIAAELAQASRPIA